MSDLRNSDASDWDEASLAAHSRYPNPSFTRERSTAPAATLATVDRDAVLQAALKRKAYVTDYNRRLRAHNKKILGAYPRLLEERDHLDGYIQGMHVQIAELCSRLKVDSFEELESKIDALCKRSAELQSMVDVAICRNKQLLKENEHLRNAQAVAAEVALPEPAEPEPPAKKLRGRPKRSRLT